MAAKRPDGMWFSPTPYRWESHYHGWHDYVMPGTLPPFDVPASIGIPRGAVDSVIVLPSDLEALERTLAADKDVAGVITEGSRGPPMARCRSGRTFWRAYGD